MDKCDDCSYYEEALDAPCYICTHVGPCPHEEKNVKHVIDCKENTDEFLYNLILDLEKLKNKYSSTLLKNHYGVCVEALNRISREIKLFTQWRKRLDG